MAVKLKLKFFTILISCLNTSSVRLRIHEIIDSEIRRKLTSWYFKSPIAVFGKGVKRILLLEIAILVHTLLIGVCDPNLESIATIRIIINKYLRISFFQMASSRKIKSQILRGILMPRWWSLHASRLIIIEKHLVLILLVVLMARVEKVYSWSSTLRIVKLVIRLLHLLLCINIIKELCLIRFLLSTWRSLPLIILKMFTIRYKMIIVRLSRSSARLVGRLVTILKISRPLSWMLTVWKSQIRNFISLHLFWLGLRIFDSSIMNSTLSRLPSKVRVELYKLKV